MGSSKAFVSGQKCRAKCSGFRGNGGKILITKNWRIPYGIRQFLYQD
jgi:hypothetical protein